MSKKNKDIVWKEIIRINRIIHSFVITKLKRPRKGNLWRVKKKKEFLSLVVFHITGKRERKRRGRRVSSSRSPNNIMVLDIRISPLKINIIPNSLSQAQKRSRDCFIISKMVIKWRRLKLQIKRKSLVKNMIPPLAKFKTIRCL